MPGGTCASSPRTARPIAAAAPAPGNAGAWLLWIALAAPPAHAQSGPVSREALGPLADRGSFGLRCEEGTRDQLWRGRGPADRDALIAEMYASSARHGELDLYSRTRSWTAEGRVRFHDRLDATLALPWIEREHRHMPPHAPFYDPRFVDGWTYDGLGDLTLLGHLRALGSAEGAALTLQAGAKLPTGRRHVPDQERTNLGMDGYEVGDGFEAGLAAGYSPLGWLTLLVQLHCAARLDAPRARMTPCGTAAGTDAGGSGADAPRARTEARFRTLS
jgi:hypothetical protein